MELKRYDIDAAGGGMEESPEGYYVRYEDIAPLLSGHWPTCDACEQKTSAENPPQIFEVICERCMK